MKHFYNLKIFKNSPKRNLRAIALCSLFLLGSHSFVNAQAKAYSFAQSTGTFTALTAGTVLATATGTSGTASLYQVTPYDVTLPFNFNYNGTVYSSIKVSSNGYITFGTTAPGTSNSTPISSTETYNGAVSVFGKSLNTFASLGGITGDIRTDVVGTAPNREMVVQWTNFRPAYSTSTTSAYAFSFQIRLKETTNVINMVYNTGAFAIGSTSVTGTAQIGLRGASSSDFNNRLNASTLAFTSSTPGTDNASTQYTSTVSTSASGMPPAGFTYTWTPPTCFAPTLTTGSSTPNSVTVNWAAPTPTPGNYDVYYNTTNIAPTSTTTPTQTNITGTTATIPSLAPITAYYVWVRSNCGSGNYSAWSAEPIVVITPCLPPGLISTTGATICPGATATLNATADAGAIVKWYDVATGGTSIASGNSYTTPTLTTTTNYWASAARESQGFVGKQTIESGATTGGGLTSYMIFSVSSTFTLQTVDLFPYSATDGTAGTVTIELRNSSGTVIASKIVNVTGHNSTANSMPQTVVLDFVIPPGSNYRLGVGAWTGITNMYRDSANLAFPYSYAGVVDITGGSLTTPYYYFFYKWGILTRCESARQQVTATVDAAACLGTSEAEAKENVKVHPNPFTEIININKAESVRTVKVIDVSGKLIKTINNPQSTINLQDLSQGLYILALEMKDGTQQSIKVIKK
ncbi:Ig-like domain-containing protein [Chryseobacterium gwangjuense]|uniref:Ig-like domain-containing protein n=1 Tax=Chryseobacterium gwangjuense TaxID=1069980 RepID=UPI001E5F78D2|nr:T9SS type A sorting domain-containing protein [Chryseobacterium gwangjuense]MCE3074922.1 T9SS type A sorting domain-containing protein [Chryseobacterium gwangjuense]